METVNQDAINKILRDIKSIPNTEILSDVIMGIQENMKARRFCKGERVWIDFALGSAEVEIKSFHYAADGSVIYHVSDIITGREDFVGQDFIKQL